MIVTSQSAAYAYMATQQLQQKQQNQFAQQPFFQFLSPQVQNSSSAQQASQTSSAQQTTQTQTGANTKQAQVNDRNQTSAQAQQADQKRRTQVQEARQQNLFQQLQQLLRVQQESKTFGVELKSTNTDFLSMMKARELSTSTSRLNSYGQQIGRVLNVVV